MLPVKHVVLRGSAVGDLLIGYMPYPSRSNQEVLEFVTMAEEWTHPKTALGCVRADLNSFKYRIMTQSWQHQPEDRPNFSTILERIDYCLQDPDVVTMPLPVEYGPVPEEEERDPSAPTVLVNAPVHDGEVQQPPPSYPTGDPLRRGEHSAGDERSIGAASHADRHDNQQHSHLHSRPLRSLPRARTSPSSTALRGGTFNLAFTQGQPQEKEGPNGNSNHLWNPTYGFGRAAPGPPLQTEAVPLWEHRLWLPGAGPAAGGRAPQPPCGPPAPAGPLHGLRPPEGGFSDPGSLGFVEDSRPLLVTMGTVQDPRLPRMEGHNATVL
ncbi:hypothetical protein KUCAC02_025504 [Chaenocephalus aceratus]|uniref:Uncharacterized protein n=1 Tax=Chaenocephalus aceratus TaxID=36190 RepID=A0ACB9VU94_CHAAC|nr:hypothetical protein KUCAC02_025504 [Chaenocephalus aceratus]